MEEKTDARCNFSLEPGMNERLKKLTKHLGLNNRSETIRYLIKQYEDKYLKE